MVVEHARNDQLISLKYVNNGMDANFDGGPHVVGPLAMAEEVARKWISRYAPLGGGVPSGAAVLLDLHSRSALEPDRPRAGSRNLNNSTRVDTDPSERGPRP